jgi:hypothetical protein
VEAREQELLSTDGLHLVAQDRLELSHAAPGEWQTCVQAGAKLANKTGAN